MEHSPQTADSGISTAYSRFFIERDPSFRLTKAIETLRNTSIELNSERSTSVSSRTQDENGESVNKITIGLKPYSNTEVERWSMGTNSNEEQILVKLAHEVAHAFQKEKGYEKSLEDFFNGSNDIPESHIIYLLLYQEISSTGRISGLANEDVYRQQSISTGDIKMEIVEEITELIASYFLGDAYFQFRLDQSLTELDLEQKESIASKIISLCAELH